MAADLPVTAPMATSDADAKPADDPIVGRKVGAYEVLRRIGQGGMGVVYEARHDKLQQRAAIKFLHQELSQDSKILQRFFNEARAISMSRHSSIVTIYDFGQLEDGTAFILMEFLEGETLLSRMERLQLQRQNLGLHMVVELGRQVAAALALIHSKSIVHRDLKPENIFVVPDSVAPLGERVKLLDFGIAKFLEGPVRKTTVGMILGTPLYMSPEQCEGAEDLDAKVDVYSLGVMLFEMLVGRLPFIADTAAALMRQHMFKEPPHLADELEDIPPELDALVSRMLAKRAADRPTMDEVMDALEGLLPQVAPAKVIAGPRAASARNRPSQPDGPRPDPYASTIGGGPPIHSPKVATPPFSSSAGRETPREPGGVASDPNGLLGSGAFSSTSGQHGIGSSASYKSLGGAPISRPSPASAASRTDAVVALGRQPLNLIIAVAVLVVLGVFGWRILAQQQPSLPTPPPSLPGTQSPTAGPPPLAPPAAPPAAPTEPTPPVKPAAAATPAPAEAHDGSEEHNDAKRKLPKRHKKGPEGGKAEDSSSGGGEADGKKVKAAKVKASGEAWDPDQ